MMFAFIRYGTREEARRVIEQFDGWIIWGYDLRLSESRYRRKFDKPLEDRAEEQTTNKEIKADPIIQRQRTGQEKTRSYKEVVESGPEKLKTLNLEGNFSMQSLGDSKIRLEKDPRMTAKLGKCLIGDTLEPYNFSVLGNSLKMEFSTIVDLAMMGDMKMLMEFDSMESMEKAYESPVLGNYFLEIRKWSPGEINRNRRMWIKVTCLPLHRWSKANMISIGSVWGK
ncbi:hypothetical protein PIB30_107317, partial [Stylosanthes scabra]|nr:hypothetical protein [Stylosanthes scabra]